MEENYRPFELVVIMFKLERKSAHKTYCENQKKSKLKSFLEDSEEIPSITSRSDGIERHPNPFGYKGKEHSIRVINKQLNSI